MFVGHYSVSFVAKGAERTVPIWVLFLAAQLVDVFWGIFVPLGIEIVDIVPGVTASNAYDLVYIPYTHSLPAAVLWAVAAGAVWGTLLRNSRRAATWVGLTVLSHWLLDLVVHLPDLPLWGDRFKVGFGLWMYRWPSFALEAVLLFAGMAVWFRLADVPRRRRRAWVLFGVGMLGLQVVTLYLPPPSTSTVAALQALFAYALFAGIAWALERRERP